MEANETRAVNELVCYERRKNPSRYACSAHDDESIEGQIPANPNAEGVCLDVEEGDIETDECEQNG